jgi:hypothetical protein
VEKSLAGPFNPVAPIKAPAASPSRWWKKIVRGQLNLSLLHVLKLQATAHVKDDADVHRHVRVLPLLLNTQSPSQEPSLART